MSTTGAPPRTLEPRQHFVAELRQLIELLKAGDRAPGEAGIGVPPALGGDVIQIPDRVVITEAVCEPAPVDLQHLLRQMAAVEPELEVVRRGLHEARCP